MDKIIERKFVEMFIQRNKQDRFLFELLSKDRRKNALSKFAHTAEEYLEIQNIYLKDTKLVINEIKKEFNKLVSGVLYCYIIAGVHDGDKMPLEQALEICFNTYHESILIVNDYLAFIKTETEYGPPVKYILYKKS